MAIRTARPVSTAAVIAARPAAPSAAAVIAFGRIAPHGPGSAMTRYARKH